MQLRTRARRQKQRQTLPMHSVPTGARVVREQYVVLEWDGGSEMMGHQAYLRLVTERHVDLAHCAVRFVDKKHQPLNLYYKFGKRR